jgi:hypothetical protein
MIPTAASALRINPTKSHDSADGPLSGGLNTGLSKKGSGKGSRRRSFDVDQSRKGPTPRSTSQAKISENNELSVSKSAAVLAQPPTDVAADSWDSVKQQPFCDVCKMAFKSLAFLDRHIKYSNLHQDNVKRLNEGDTSVIAAHLPTTITEEKIVQKQQEEGTHYRLLYSGSKFYWRCQQSIDLDIYHHFLSHAVEIIPFQLSKQKEMPRIYLDYELVLQHVLPSVEEEVQQKKQAITSENKYSFKDIDEIKMKQEITLVKIVTYLLQRIMYEPKAVGSISASLHTVSKTIDEEGKGGENNHSAAEALKHLNESILNVAQEDVCVFTALFSDKTGIFPVLEKPPVTLIPIHVNRRRRSTAEEFDHEMRSIDKEQSFIKANIEKAQELTKANERAEKIAYFVYTAAQLIKERRYSYSDIKHKYKRLWLWAAHRVVYLNNVVKNRQVLNERGLNVVPCSPYKPARVRERPVADEPHQIHYSQSAEDPIVNRMDSLVQN